MPHLYLIAGCNGAGKTTASQTLLPYILDCREFVNADAIAAALSPYHPESVAIEAGRIMLQRIDHLLEKLATFAIETTLATRTYVSTIKRAQMAGYACHLAFFYLESPEIAFERVARRVSLGGHNIPPDVIERRYQSGLQNFFKLYQPICDSWFFYNNTDGNSVLVAEGNQKLVTHVKNQEIWTYVNESYGTAETP